MCMCGVCVLTWLCACACTLCCGVYVELWCCVFCWWCVVWCGVVLFCVVWCGLACGKLPPCVDSKRLRVCVQDAAVCGGKTPACSKHAGVFRVHTEAS